MHFLPETDGFPPGHVLPAAVAVPIVFAPPTLARAVAASVAFVLPALVGVVSLVVCEALATDIMPAAVTVFYAPCSQPQLEH